MNTNLDDEQWDFATKLELETLGFKGTFTGNVHISWENLWFPVKICPETLHCRCPKARRKLKSIKAAVDRASWCLGIFRCWTWRFNHETWWKRGMLKMKDLTWCNDLTMKHDDFLWKAEGLSMLPRQNKGYPLLIFVTWLRNPEKKHGNIWNNKFL